MFRKQKNPNPQNNFKGKKNLTLKHLSRLNLQLKITYRPSSQAVTVVSPTFAIKEIQALISLKNRVTLKTAKRDAFNKSHEPSIS